MALRRAAVLSLLSVAAACTRASDPGCLAGEDGCQVPSPCAQLAFECASTALEAQALTAEAAVGLAAAGGKVRAAEGDYLLGNGSVRAVISGPLSAAGRDLGGGALIDLFPLDGTGTPLPDGFSRLVQAFGDAPEDLVRYESFALLDEGPDRVALQLRGRIAGRPALRVHTVYELRACDRGVRIRTEVINEGEVPLPLRTTDRVELDEPIRTFAPPAPNGEAALASAGLGDTAFSEVACSAPQLTVTRRSRRLENATPVALIGPRDFQLFERFVAVPAAGASAQDVARQVRAQLFAETQRTVRATFAQPSGSPLSEGSTWVETLVSGSVHGAARVAPDGTFAASVPAGVASSLRVHRLGETLEPVPVASGADDVDLGVLPLSEAARMVLQVRDQNGQPVSAEVIVSPAAEQAPVEDPATGRSCGVLLGEVDGATRCDRVVAPATVELAPGAYRLVAHRGPGATLDVRDLTLSTGDQPLSLAVQTLAGLSNGTVHAELHVHGDGDDGSARTLEATGIDLAVNSVSGAVSAAVTGPLSTLPGTEFAPELPSLTVPLRDGPVTSGHFGAWPLRRVPGAPRDGLPRADGFEPGAFLQQLLGRYSGVHVIQLQHPWLGAVDEAGTEYLGFPRAIGLDAQLNLPSPADESANGIFVRAATAGALTNDAYHAQEVFSGAAGEQLLAQRALWFYLLNQGVLRTGTASGHSHREDDLPGLPRSLVSAPTGTSDPDGLSEAIRAGHVLGTNGPLIEAELVLPGDVRSTYGFQLTSGPSVANFAVRVSAAPWVPVQELRAVVNGQVVRVEPLTPVTDPLGSAEVVRYDALIPVGELVTGIAGDVWVVFEAGASLPLAADLGGGPAGGRDGIPDTTDNNGDGTVDASDVEPGATSGPLRAPSDGSPQGVLFHRVAGAAGPYAFTNPFLLDRNANGRFDAPGLTGGRLP